MNETKLDLTKPVQTRDGRRVEILTTKAKGFYPIFGNVENFNHVQCWTALGKYSSDSHTSQSDLINVPQPPKYRPFTPEEAVRRVGEKFKSKDGKCLCSILGTVKSDGRLGFTDNCMTLFNDWTFLDGSPAGMLQEDAQ